MLPLTWTVPIDARTNRHTAICRYGPLVLVCCAVAIAVAIVVVFVVMMDCCRSAPLSPVVSYCFLLVLCASPAGKLCEGLSVTTLKRTSQAVVDLGQCGAKRVCCSETEPASANPLETLRNGGYGSPKGTARSNPLCRQSTAAVNGAFLLLRYNLACSQQLVLSARHSQTRSNAFHRYKSNRSFSQGPSPTPCAAGLCHGLHDSTTGARQRLTARSPGLFRFSGFSRCALRDTPQTRQNVSWTFLA